MRKRLAASIVPTLLALACGPSERSERAHTALTGGYDDADTPIANIVVATGCTGTLITPTVVLTAAHCVTEFTGRMPRISVGAKRNAFIRSVPSVWSAIFGEPMFMPPNIPPLNKWEVGKDIAVIILDPRQPQMDLMIRRPSLESPVPDRDGDYRPRYPSGRIGMAGWSPTGGQTNRQVAEFTWLDLKIGEHRGGRLWLWDPKSDVSLHGGDSGGPLYQTYCSGKCVRWPDVARVASS
jgi:hypothetical protein